MSQFLMSIRRQKTTCPNCCGQGCSKCKGLGQRDVRPEKTGRIVVIGMIFGLFLIFCISMLLAKKAKAADSPEFPTIIETTQPHVVEEEIQVPPCHVTPNYPEGIMQWCEMITAAAHKYGIESDLIAAVMLQESGGDAEAYSSSGAVGLMQVMPRDGIAASFECINGPCFASRPTIEELSDPDFNIQYGAHMLARLIDTNNGSLREALKAYGPGDYGYIYADKVLAIMDKYK
jgi:hypothetical protein